MAMGIRFASTECADRPCWQRFEPGTNDLTSWGRKLSRNGDSSLFSTRSKGIGIPTRSVSEGCSNSLAVRKRDPR